MGITIGLDIGTVSLKMAALGCAEDRQVLENLCLSNAAFRLHPEELPDRTVALSEYRRMAVNTVDETLALLKEFYVAVPEQHISGLRVTGSGGGIIAERLGTKLEVEYKAIARMMAEFYPEVRTVFEFGSRTFKFISLDEEEGPCCSSNFGGRKACNEGMGLFLEQQASRMNVSLDAIDVASCSAAQCPRMTSGCSVFIKSDMIHSQQKGYSPEEVFRGLHDAMATKFKNDVVRGNDVVAPVAVIGAVSKNSGVVRALGETFELKDEELFVPDLHSWCSAIGVAMLGSDAGERSFKPSSFAEISKLLQQGSEIPADDIPPLSQELVTYLSDVTPPYVAPSGDVPIPAYLGIDIGSVSSKLVLINEAGTLMDELYLPTAGAPVEAVSRGLEKIVMRWGSRLDIRGVGTTGSGRELIAEFIGADVIHDEITAHKTGAIHISEIHGGEPVDTIFEIGGQDSKYIHLENGVVTDFNMNDVCAAGTGSFLEEQSEILGVPIKEVFSKLALSALAPARLGEFCTVATGNDVMTRLQKGESMSNLLAGLAHAIARNFMTLVVSRRTIGKVVYFQGGTASNRAVAAAFAGLLGRKIIVPPHNGVIGALGVALMARKWGSESESPSRFRGFKLGDLQYAARNFTCKGCTNRCEVKEFTIDGERSYWGCKCSDRYYRPAVSDRKPIIPDLIAYREELFNEIARSGLSEGKLRIGLPRALTYFDLYPFWHRYLTQLGMQVVLSPVSDANIIEAGEEIADVPYCLPLRTVLGHVQHLTETDVDYVLFPSVDSTGTEDQSSGESCLWMRTVPHTLGFSEALQEQKGRLLTPSIPFADGWEAVKAALHGTFFAMGITREDSDRAVDAAYAAQNDFQYKVLAAGQAALKELESADEPGVVLVGRTYSIYDRNLTCDLPRKLRLRYGANVIPLDFLVTGETVDGSTGENLVWESGKKILEAAQFVSTHSNLHLIFASNFLCGPDDSARHVARRTSGQPFLWLKFDGLGWDSGYMTRCEAYLDSKGILRSSKLMQITVDSEATC